MTCTSPYKLKLSKYKEIEVPCGNCRQCRIRRSREWTARLLNELVYHEWASFITLTYTNMNLPIMTEDIVEEFMPYTETLSKLGIKQISSNGHQSTLIKRDLQNFFKRLRKKLKKIKKSHAIKYFACGEYGETYARPHYHIIMFGLDQRHREIIEESWNMGIVDIGSVTYDSARYVADYIQKKMVGKLQESEYGKLQPPFQLQSKGLGLKFAMDNREYIEKKLGQTINGNEVGLPRYYREKLEIDPIRIAERTEKKEQERRRDLREKGAISNAKEIMVYDHIHNKQIERNTEARLSLRGKGKL